MGAGNGHAGNGHGAAADPRRPRHAADSVQAGQVMAGATELVPGPDARPAAATQTANQQGGLPVRVRQAALAPQLRGREATDSGASPVPPAAPASPEAVRSTISAMQRGWERGRSAAGNRPAGTGPDAGPDAAATAERNPADQGPGEEG
jgi:hypothetical protein